MSRVMIGITKIAVFCNNRMAIPALQALYAQGRLCAVGVAEGNTDVVDFCSQLSAQSGIPLLMINRDELSSQIEDLFTENNVQYIFTMTFPWKIPSEILNKYQNKLYNFHYGLLPEMRGADPVFESIRSGAGETGITVHAIEEKIDKGAIILKKVLPLSINMTHGLLCTNLSWLGANLLNELFPLLKNKTEGKKQDENSAKYYRKPNAADVCISWQKNDAKTIEALSRACNPWNKGAYTQWNGWNIRVVEATIIENNTGYTDLPGTILSMDKENGLVVKCNNDTQLRIDIVYTDEGFMSGYKLSAFGIKKGYRFVSM